MTSNNKNNNTSYMAMNGRGMAVKRIRAPAETDILLGRGGGINGHPGNRVFREWIKTRKEAYNLAPNKTEKTHVASEVMDWVRQQNPPGRFLHRESGIGASSGWWMEVDEARALAKTSQALREGAPQIRAAHKNDVPVNLAGRKAVTRKRKVAPMIASNVIAVAPTLPTVQLATPIIATTAWPETVPPAISLVAPITKPTHSSVPRTAMGELSRSLEQAKKQASTVQQEQPYPSYTRPLMSNREFQQWDNGNASSRNKRQRAADACSLIDNEATPPLTSVSQVPLPSFPPPMRLGRTRSSSKNNLTRSHSMALSDFSYSESPSGDDDFINPFLDESAIYDSNLYPSQTTPTTSKSSTTTIPSSPARPTSKGNNMVRNVSSDEGREDYKSMMELYQFPNKSNGTTTFLSLPPPQMNYGTVLHEDVVHDVGDFNSELKTIIDAAHPEDDLTGGKEMPTLLIPWRGGALKRRYSSGGILSQQPSSHRERQ